jgi:hypothetical protein
LVAWTVAETGGQINRLDSSPKDGQCIQMRMSSGPALLTILAALTACGPMPATPPPSAPYAGPSVPAAVEDSCGARAQAGLVNQNVAALERVLIIGPVRVIGPGDAVTMDFNETRINFELNQFDQIARIFCG